MDEFGIAQAQPVVNPTAGKIADLLRRAKEFGNQYEVKDYVPFFGGTGIGDLFLGQAPEEVNRWSYGDYPFRNPSSVVGTGGNRLDVWKTGRFEPTFDVVANVALPAVGTAQMTAKPLARALAPKAAEMAENYLTKTGAIANITEPSPVKIAEALRQPTKNELGFYSPLDEAVMNLQNPKGTGQQYLAQLLKTQGVKQEEVSTRGLDTFLTNNPKVSREQIAQYLKENPVELKETTLAEPRNEWQGNFLMIDRTAVAKIEENADGNYVLRDTINNKVTPLNVDKMDQAVKKAEEIYGVSGEVTPYSGKPKYADYVLPNGENYREVLIQYPNTKSEKFDPSKVEIVRNRQSATQGSYTIKYNGKEIQTYGDEFDPKNNYKGLSDEEIIKTAKQLFEEGNKFQQIKPMSGNFISGHFDQPNILAHMRVTDRTIDGKKTLFVEEIQSDWHQTGRKKGYFDQKAIDNNIEEQKRLVEIKTKALKDAEPYTDKGMDAPQEILDMYTSADDRLNALRKEESKLKNAIPDAPFKKNWQELTMKRAMQMAAEGGYDRVAFTTGKQQNARYNLSKQIDKILYSPYPDGTFEISAVLPSGQEFSQVAGKKTLDEIENIFGKEIANKVSKGEKTSVDSGTNVLSGVDLDVGGEGMKGFYDKILPDFINKYGKKHGLKVGQTKLPPNLNINSMVLNQTGLSRKEWDELSIADKERTLKEMGYGGNEGVHYFDLTPEAKESFLSKGQPLFAVPPAMAITDEDSRRDMLEKLFNNQK